MSELPFHPTTGIQAIGMVRRGPIWPIMGASEDHGAGDAGGGGGAEADSATESGEQNGNPGRGFPEGTPIAEMTDAQQAVYWRFHSRRKDDVLKAYNGITADQALALQTRNAELERQQMSAADQVLATARDEATAAATAAAAEQWAPEFARAIVGQFITDQDQRDGVLSGIDPMVFMTDGTFDTDALIGHLTGLQAAFGGSSTGGDQQQKPPSQWGQNGSHPPAQSGRDEGLAEAKRRGYIKE